MLQFCGMMSFTQKTSLIHRVVNEMRSQHFKRDQSSRPCVNGSVDDRHAAATDFLFNSIVAKSRV